MALLITLIPFIQAGIVHLVPDPTQFNDVLREVIWKIAEEKKETVELTPADQALAQELGKDAFKRALARLPDMLLQSYIRVSSPQIPEKDLQAVIQYIRDQQAQDPLALLQPMVTGEAGAQLLQFRGVNFELAIFFSQLMGAAIYTDQQLTQNELASARIPDDSPACTASAGDLARMLPVRVGIGDNPTQVWDIRETPDSLAYKNRHARSLESSAGCARLSECRREIRCRP